LEAFVVQELTEDVVRAALTAFDAAEPVMRGDFENYIYEVTQNGERRILRLVHASHRIYEQVAAELNWVQFLASSGVAVATALPSTRGRLIETIDAPRSAFFASLFTFAPGFAVKTGVPDGAFGPPLFRLWGATVGQMHAATKRYQTPPGAPVRLRWDEEELTRTRQLLDDTDAIVRERGEELIATLKSIDVDETSFGLIHTDIHLGNFHVDGERLTVFDFDDCAYHFFVSDIAMALYYALWSIPDADEIERSRFAHDFLRTFMEGYYKHNDLDITWLAHIPTFLKLRDVTVYTVLRVKVEYVAMSERQLRLLQTFRSRIEANQPVVRIDMHLLENFAIS